MGAAAVGATIYFGSEQSTRQIVEISQAFAKAHELGMAPSCGAICATTLSKRTRTITFRPILPDKPIT